jgi:hypothetical protein
MGWTARIIPAAKDFYLPAATRPTVGLALPPIGCVPATPSPGGRATGA